MADATVVDKFPKATNTRADVEKVRQAHLTSGAKNAILAEDEKDWILITIWAGDC